MSKQLPSGKGLNLWEPSCVLEAFVVKVAISGRTSALVSGSKSLKNSDCTSVAPSSFLSNKGPENQFVSPRTEAGTSHIPWSAGL